MQALCEEMKTEATYSLQWYELDQPIKVGMVDEFLFVRDQQPLQFYSGLHHPERWTPIQGKILSITHPELGGVSEINTQGLDYTITLCDGTSFKVEAEETPGDVYDHPVKPSDWTFTIEMETHNNTSEHIP
jgi:hypothetical protein